MRKLLLLLAMLVTWVSTYSQNRIRPFEIHYRDQSTSWEFVNVGGDDVPYLYFYLNNQTDIRRNLVKIAVTNGWKDSFVILGTGVFTREGSGVSWRAVDRENVNCILELVIRKEVNPQYTQLYIRYTNIEYVYSFMTN